MLLKVFILFFFCQRIEGLTRKVRFIYITEVCLPSDDGSCRFRKSVLAEVEYVKYLVDLLNHKRFHYHKGFVLELIEVRNHTDHLNEYMVNTFVKQNALNQSIDIFIGPQSSNAIAKVIGVNWLLVTSVFSNGATSSKFDKIAKKYSIARFLPSDAFRTAMLIKVINHYGWDYLAVLSSSGTNYFEAQGFITKILGSVCINIHYGIVANSDICNMVRNLNKLPNEVVVFFTTPSDTRYVLKCMRQQGLYQRFTLVFFYGSNNDQDIVEDNEKLLDGSIGLDHSPGKRFDSFYPRFHSLNPKTSPNNTFLKLHWERAFNCNAYHLEGQNPNGYHNNCSFSESLSNQNPMLSPAGTYITMIFLVFSRMIKTTMERFCPNYKESDMVCDKEVTKPGFRIKEYIDELPRHHFRVDNFYSSSKIVSYDVINGVWNKEIKSLNRKKVGYFKIKIGSDLESYPEDLLRTLTVDNITWTSKVWWGHRLGQKSPLGKCSKPCKHGHTYLFNYTNIGGKFCWKCIPCTDNQIIVNNTCVRCNRLERADPLQLKCLPMIRKELLSSKHMFAVFMLWGVLAFGAALDMIVLGFVSWNRFLALFGVSGYALWLFIVVGILLSLFGSLTFSLPPTVGVCYIQLYIPSVGLLLCHVALCAKAFRIRDTFVGVSKVPHFRLSFGRHSYEAISVFVVMMQLSVLAVLAFAFQRIKVKESLSDAGDYVSRHCNLSMHPIVFLLDVIVVLICSFESYLIRSYPQNHGEAKDIVVTSLLSLMLLFFGVSTYLARQKDAYYKEILMSWFYAANAMIVLFGLFSRKIFILIQQKIKPKRDQSINSPRFRTFSENITNNINNIKSIETHAILPQPPMPNTVKECDYYEQLTIFESKI